MKLVIAMIQPDRLDAVQEAMEQIQINSPFISASDASDLRDQTTETYRGARHRTARLKMRLEVLVVNDLRVEETVEAIAGAAYSGTSSLYGKGNIIVIAVEEWIPIRGREPRFEHAPVG